MSNTLYFLYIFVLLPSNYNRLWAQSAIFYLCVTAEKHAAPQNFCVFNTFLIPTYIYYISVLTCRFRIVISVCTTHYKQNYLTNCIASFQMTTFSDDGCQYFLKEKPFQSEMVSCRNS